MERVAQRVTPALRDRFKVGIAMVPCCQHDGTPAAGPTRESGPIEFPRHRAYGLSGMREADVRAAQGNRAVALTGPAAGAARRDHAVARAPQGHGLDRRLDRYLRLDRRLVDRVAGDELINPP